MKLRKFLALMLASLMALGVTSISQAQIAYNTAFSTSITVANVGTGPAKITVTYYGENSGSGTSVAMPDLAAGASTSIVVGNVSSLNAGFKGAAVLSSSQPVVATLVQVPQGNGGVKNRPLSNGFQAGTSRVLLATVLKNRFNSTSRFAVQNAGSAPATFTVKLYNADNPSAAPITMATVSNLPVGATRYFDMGEQTNVPNGFNGSAVVEGTGVSLVATVLELSTNARGASAFEGVASGANKVYMPSALCNFNMSGKPGNTAYAIQNVGTTPTVATVKFSNGRTVTTATIPPNGKASVQGCDGGNPNAFSGSAEITASNNGQIVAIGKVVGENGPSTAFLGETAGASKLALPYVRWTTSDAKYNAGTHQRTYIAIQNIGTTTIPAGQIKVNYIDSTGKLVGTHTINTALAPGAKANSNAGDLGAVAGDFGHGPPVYGGGAQIIGPDGSQLIAVARVQTFMSDLGTVAAEDYNAVPIQ